MGQERKEFGRLGGREGFTEAVRCARGEKSGSKDATVRREKSTRLSRRSVKGRMAECPRVGKGQGSLQVVTGGRSSRDGKRKRVRRWKERRR